MKVLIVKNWNEHSECDWEETEIVCASEDESKLNVILVQLCKECLAAETVFKWKNEKFGVQLQKRSEFHIVDLKVI